MDLRLNHPSSIHYSPLGNSYFFLIALIPQLLFNVKEWYLLDNSQSSPETYSEVSLRRSEVGILNKWDKARASWVITKDINPK